MQDTPYSILITGASSGIGEALAHHYANSGIILYLSGRNKERLEQVEVSCVAKGAEVTVQLIDTTDRQAMRDWIDSIEKLDLVIANAGISLGGLSPLDDSYEEASRQIFEVNLMGVLNTLHPAIDKMKEQGKGQIALVSSLAGYRGLPTAPAYSASKTAVKAYGEALAPSLKKIGISLSIIFPGFVRSRITDKNKFPMPFFMEADKAAELIANRLEQKKLIIAFPWQMRFVSWCFRALPSSLAVKLLSLSKEKKG